MMQLNLMNIILVYPSTSFNFLCFFNVYIYIYIYIYIFYYYYYYYNHFLEHILNLNYKILSKKVEAKELGSFIAILCYFYIESLQCFSFLFLASCGLITPPLSPGTLFTYACLFEGLTTSIASLL